MTEFDVQTYLRLVELEDKVKLGDPPSLELLRLLVKHQVTHVAYQKLDLLITKAEADLNPSALLQRLLIENRGGVCFELCELMLAVLLAFKFDARRVATHCLGAFEPSGPIDNHPIIVVNLYNRMYHVDVGFAYNSIREPLEFSYDETQDRSGLPFEKYRLNCLEDHYVIQMWIKNAWKPLYRFERPLHYLNDELSMKKYRECISFSGHLPVRDTVFLAGIATNTGRIGFWSDFDSKMFKCTSPYMMGIVDNCDTMKTEIVDFGTFSRGLQKIVNVQVIDDHFQSQ